MWFLIYFYGFHFAIRSSVAVINKSPREESSSHASMLYRKICFINMYYHRGSTMKRQYLVNLNYLSRMYQLMQFYKRLLYGIMYL